MRARPDYLKGATYRIPSPLGTVFTTINDEDGKPFELFANVGKSGSSTTAMAEAIARLVSLIFRLEEGDDRIEMVISQLRDIGGGVVAGAEGEIFSVPDAISQALERHTNEAR